MKLCKAIAVKTRTSDGVDFLDLDKVGKIYTVDLDRIVTIDWFRSDTGKKCARESIWVLPGGWMPLELLELERASANI